MKRMLLAITLVLAALGLTGCTPVLGGRITITAYLPDSAGLFVGNDVGVLGVPVGKITAIKPEGDHVKVTLWVKSSQPIPADAGAAVVARSVATDRYIEMTPVYHSGPRMKDGAVIDLENTRSPVDFDDVLASLKDFADGITGSKQTSEAVRQFIEAGAEALEGTGTDFNRAVTSLSGAVDAVSGQREDLTASVRSLDQLTTAIAANRQVVEEFISQVSQASRLLADERENFDRALTSLGTAVELVADFVHEHRQELVRSLNQSTGLMNVLLAKREQLTEVVRVMPLMLENFKVLAQPDGRLLVRVDPSVITPLGGLVDELCQAAPVDGCAAFGPSLFNLNNALGLLGLS